jgi:hypothetical protein
MNDIINVVLVVIATAVGFYVIKLLFLRLLKLFNFKFKILLIGRLSVVSNRNFESNYNYVLLKSYAGTSNNDLIRNKARTIEEAIDIVVKSTAGGEFLKNIKIYELYKSNQNVKENYYAVEGDVWGLEDKNLHMQQGFKVGDKVMYRDLIGKKKIGVIQNLKNEETCIVKIDGKESVVELSYDFISKIN